MIGCYLNNLNLDKNHTFEPIFSELRINILYLLFTRKLINVIRQVLSRRQSPKIVKLKLKSTFGFSIFPKLGMCIVFNIISINLIDQSHLPFLNKIVVR